VLGKQSGKLLKPVVPVRDILRFMTHAAQTDSAPSFAGLLAALAAPAQKPSPAWHEDELADDVTSLSYESALRAHARYRYAHPSDKLPAPDANLPRRQIEPEASSNSIPATKSIPRCATPPTAAAQPATARQPFTPFERDLKSASITIRMSQAECAQVHQRAAEAGLTISAYLRSCTLEAESLRAMVKETMAQLRSNGAGKQEAPAAASQPRRNRMTRFFAPWHNDRRIGPA
jgi:hypothetical protein